MKAINKYLLSAGLTISVALSSCTKNFDEINTDPNNPTKVTPGTLMLSAQKTLLDDIYDEWFAGRSTMVYSQYFTQRNYTTEDRYSLRENVNNNYFKLIYNDINDLNEVIRLNTDPSTKSFAALYGKNENQIAAAMILKAWAMQIVTDTWGDVPYFEAFKGKANPSPAYSKQAEIYADLIKQLTDAVNMIDEGETVFTAGDIIYEGDATKWKKFGNSLKCRVAVRMSKVDTKWKQYISEAVASGVFESNSDDAKFKYTGVTPNNAPLYDAYFTSNRNDFTIAAPIINIMKGVNDQLNNKVNPFKVADPRLAVFAYKVKGDDGVLDYRGMPYGMPDAETKGYAKYCPNFYVNPTFWNQKDYALTYMSYSELCFILSEANGWDNQWYKDGIKASMESHGVEAADITAFLTAAPAANAETVATQKYVALFPNGSEAWAEVRRTGYPTMLVKPGEISGKVLNSDGVTYRNVVFTPLKDTQGRIPTRSTYPQQEYTINMANTVDAAESMGGDFLYTPMWWSKE